MKFPSMLLAVVLAFVALASTTHAAPRPCDAKLAAAAAPVPYTFSIDRLGRYHFLPAVTTVTYRVPVIYTVPVAAPVVTHLTFEAPAQLDKPPGPYTPERRTPIRKALFGSTGVGVVPAGPVTYYGAQKTQAGYPTFYDKEYAAPARNWLFGTGRRE